MSAVLSNQKISTYPPGALVKARGREWIVMPGSSQSVLRLRPLSGSESDVTVISPLLESQFDPVIPASFPIPTTEQIANHEEALLLRDALLMSLRRGAGPFRSFGNLAFQPRAYQLVPLLMALQQDVIRLLIADDVGIGKTIEAGMIAREFLDRGEIHRFAVLCPPHLVEQWVQELDDRFHIKAVAVTAASAARLERGLPVTDNIFTVHPYTVVSLDYIKSDRRRGDFASRCPELVIVDEAHTCAGSGSGRHQRHDLLRLLSADSARHMLFLTATPHSGDEDSFHSLLGLLDTDFQQLGSVIGNLRDELRKRLSFHFVQRRRQDINEWNDDGVFPRKETSDLPYQLSGNWGIFFDSVLDYCSEVVERAGTDQRRQRLNFWGTLALMRSAASSPAAALQSLRTRMSTQLSDTDEDILRDRVFDGAEDVLVNDDAELPADSSDPGLNNLIEQAKKLAEVGGDPKLTALQNHLKNELINNKFSPVIFCRYIATAHYLHSQLKNKFPGLTVGVVTGELSPDERKSVVAELGKADHPMLIATDCMSEGINLQEYFNAVVHYDLSWNPTRHEQREGRVDRFGQESRVVRATLMYGQNNPVDAVVLKVILRKAKKIREELGVPVPLPDEDHSLTQALMQAVLSGQRGRQRQDSFEFDELPAVKKLDTAWTDMSERAKKNRTVFAQNRIKPEDVLPEWNKMQAALGNSEDVLRFIQRALSRLGGDLEARNKSVDKGYRANLVNLPEDLKERLLADDISGSIGLSFSVPASVGTRFVHRSHPLVSTLAEGLLERTLSNAGIGNDNNLIDPSVLGRAGCWVSKSVELQTTILMLRLRHQLSSSDARGGDIILVEEAIAVALRSKEGGKQFEIFSGSEPLNWLTEPPVESIEDRLRSSRINSALDQHEQWLPVLQNFAQERSEILLADHRRVRKASDSTGRYRVIPLLPVDVIGVYVLLPALGL